LPYGIISHQQQRPLVWKVRVFQFDKNPVSVSTPPVIVYKTPFTISSNTFHTQKWYNLGRDNVLRWHFTSSLAFLVGWPENQSSVHWQNEANLRDCEVISMRVSTAGVSSYRLTPRDRRARIRCRRRVLSKQSGLWFVQRQISITEITERV
jgi:hypothetical protein